MSRGRVEGSRGESRAESRAESRGVEESRGINFLMILNCCMLQCLSECGLLNCQLG